MTISPAEWAALCARTESEREEEWPAILWVIRNRIEAPAFPSRCVRVVRQPWQFSAFNEYRTSSDTSCWERMAESEDRYWRDWRRAIPIAEAVLAAPRSPFDNTRMLYFWSPRSMQPPGSDPKWAINLARVVALPGIDPWRFKFGEERAPSGGSATA